MPFNCAMCTPTEMSLKTIQDEIMLCNMPASEIEKLYTNHWEDRGKIIDKGSELSRQLYGKAHDIRICLTSKSNAAFQLTLLGLKFDVNPQENCIKCKNITMPLFMNMDNIILRIITDTNAVEVYADQGEAFLCTEHTADYNLNKLIISSCNDDIIVHEIKIDTLRSIWEDMGW